jgi:GNAT superfamily N-acetyltransferase
MRTRRLGEAIEANRFAFWADYGRSSRVEVHDEPDMMWFVTGIPSPGGNGVCRTRFERADVDARIEAVLDHFRARNVPLTWHVGPTTRPRNLGKRLLAHGLQDAGCEPGMVVDLALLDDSADWCPGLDIQRVCEPEELDKWMDVFATGFKLPRSVADAMYELELDLGLAQHPPRQLYLGSLHGRPVATSLLFLGAGVAGIYGVTTLPHARRKGIGAAMTRVPLLKARATGYPVGVLHASAMGASVYRRLGFRECCQLRYYAWTGAPAW